VRRPTARRRDGFGLLDGVVAAALGTVVLAGAVALTSGVGDVSAGSQRRGALAARVAEVTDRIVRELQVAGLRGEDVNGNGVADPGEDTNRNGRLDADWDLQDGSAAAALTFNMLDARTWTFGPPVTYRVEAGVLLRVQDGAAVEVARGVEAFQVARDATVVTVSLTLGGRDSRGERWTEQAERRVHVRN
jgi:type II secretory pathway component PulJ